MRAPKKTRSEGTAVASNRRTAERFATVRDATCSPLTARHAEVTVRIRDVSANGIGLLSGRRFERGTVLLIHVLDESQSLPLQLVGKVVHVTAGARGDWLIGCTLARGLSEADIRALAEEGGGAA